MYFRDNNTKSSLDDIFLNYDLQKTYFQLMCVFEPDSAIAYVKSNDMLKVDAVLEVTFLITGTIICN